MLETIVHLLNSPYFAAGLTLLGFLPFAWKRFLTYLHIFQQEEYDGARFLRWLAYNVAIDTRASLAVVVLFALSKIYPAPVDVLSFFIVVIFLVLARRESDPRQVGKKKLAMTQRATRILR